MGTRSPIKVARSGSNFDAVRLFIEYKEPSGLTPAARPTKWHTAGQVKQLAAAIDRNGFNVPILVDDADRVVAGHARLDAAKSLGLTRVPVIKIAHLSDEQLRLFAIFDHKFTSAGELDVEAIRLELEEISIAVPTLDLTDSGFALAEIDAMNGLHRTNQLADLDDDGRCQPGPPVSRLGDLWRMGRHRVICGDATDAAVIARLVGDREVRALIADAPYNLRIPGVVSGKGAVRHVDFAMASGEMSADAFVAFLGRFFAAAQPTLIDGALLFVFMDWRHLAELTIAARAAGLDHKQTLVWIKSNPGLGGLYRNAHEMIGVFKHGDASYRNNNEMGRYGRNRSNTLHYPGVNTFGKGRRKALELHPTVKGVALIADLILDCTAPRELVLDSFGGSGTTAIAADAVDRDACLCELDPGFVDTTLERYRAKTSIEAILVETGQSFAEVKAARSAPVPEGEN